MILTCWLRPARKTICFSKSEAMHNKIIGECKHPCNPHHLLETGVS
ncbi:hypothetical protein EFT36_01940 [Raoultella ornithinolytica]|nr:hypothetical protein EFT36_01940 [Raoultella ornithinolytica]